jgi:hypothetical protein
MTRLLLIAVLLVLPLHNSHSKDDANPFQTYGHRFEDLLDAVRTLRKKTNQAAFFWLEMPQYPTAPVFAPGRRWRGILCLTCREDVPQYTTSQRIGRGARSFAGVPAVRALIRQCAPTPCLLSARCC